MTLPGHEVTIGERQASTTTPGSTSNAFVVGFLDRGPTDRPFLVRSAAELVEKGGPRTAESSMLWDALDVAFREGLSAAYIGRVVGDDAAPATHTILDGSNATTGHATAVSPGAWGNLISTQITGSAGAFVVIVKYDGATQETSPTLASMAEAVAWAASTSKLIEITDDPASANGPKAQTVTLAGGDDDYAAADIDNFTAALDLFTRDLGPGQVAAPGLTSSDQQAALVAHALANNRRAIIDIDDSADETDLTTVAAAIRGEDGDRVAAAFAPWAIVPGVSIGTHRTVPYSAVQLGLIARAEAEGLPPNRAAAGKRGRARYAYDLTQHYTDAQLEALNDAGINGVRLINGVVTTFGNRTFANPVTDGDWKWLSASRQVMACAAAADTVLEDYEFDQIDGHGHVFKDLEGDLKGRALMPFYLADALYGQTPDEAFSVETGPDVNTPSTIADGQIKAQIAIRVSESAERLSVEIVKVPTTETL